MKCFVCGSEMRLPLVEPHDELVRPGFEYRTFRCESCEVTPNDDLSSIPGRRSIRQPSEGSDVKTFYDQARLTRQALGRTTSPH